MLYFNWNSVCVVLVCVICVCGSVCGSDVCVCGSGVVWLWCVCVLLRLPYQGLFGGVTALNREQFQKINGYPNNYWGWGGGDDDVSGR